jgi:class 3 adenylate cyclase
MMAAIPETRYVRSGDVHIAYQVLDEGGPHTFVGLPPIVSNIDVMWENPSASRFTRRLARLGKFVHFDKRGQGMSDRDSGVPTIDERVDDLLAVVDAIGVDQMVLGGISEGGGTAAMFAATHPDRVSHLILIGSFAALKAEVGMGITVTPEFFERWAAVWGTPDSLTPRLSCPIGIREGQTTVEWMNRYERQSSSPGGLLAASRWITQFDLSSLLPTIRVPTLVVHSRDDVMVPVAAGRHLAKHIPGSSLVEVGGVDHMPWFGDPEPVPRAIEEFVTGSHAEPEPDRMLATVLFTDIVGSTRMAAELGDRRWREILDDYDDLVRREVAAAAGRVVKSTGDGSLATFDRPGRALQLADRLRMQVRAIGVEIRAGLHTGEIEVRGDDVGGIAVHLAARVCGAAGASEVLVSRTVTDLVAGSGHAFDGRGEHELKGIPGSWQLYALS